MDNGAEFQRFGAGFNDGKGGGRPMPIRRAARPVGCSLRPGSLLSTLLGPKGGLSIHPYRATRGDDARDDGDDDQ
jgi:hypothetical protein